MTSHFNKKAKKKIKSSLKKHFIRGVIIILGLVLILISGFLCYLLAYKDVIYPNLSIAGVNVARNKQADAAILISKSITVPSEVSLIYQDQNFVIKTEDVGFYYDYYLSTAKAYEFARTGNFFTDLEIRTKLIFYPQNLDLVVKIDGDKLSKIVSIIAGQISIDPVMPSVSKINGGVSVNKGSAGKEVNQDKLIKDITTGLSQNTNKQIQIPVDNIDNSLSDGEAIIFSQHAEKYLGKSISLKFEYKTITLNDTDIFKILDPRNGYKEDALSSIVQKTIDTIEREPQNPKFVFLPAGKQGESGKVTEFLPALEGIKINKDSLKGIIIAKLDELTQSTEKNLDIDIPVIKTLPDVTTEKVNDLGIKELIGRGTSTYFHSIPGRVHNVSLATSRINGTLVKPGETFSFNQTLGDISAFTGYQQAYIISEGKTILGDGGGVCQVSSTLFRALLNAGLPITERQAHAYRVSYYEQGSPPGLDATVYSPSPDLKFTNDTPAYILIEASADTKNYSLVFELYGTNDKRISTISKSIVTNVTPPPEDLYQDDPTLPIGKIKQIDYKAWGAKVTFNYVVTRDGEEIIRKTFVSNYKPWQAVYLRGTGPAN
jgi:vancomycin resistance protein YoaR